MAKTVFSLILLCFFFGCAAKTQKKTSMPTEPNLPSAKDGSSAIDSGIGAGTNAGTPTTGTPTPLARGLPKIGLIFSGGGAKAWAHIGFIKEIEKSKWPIHSVAGFEWGAAVAAIYANNFSSNEVEWELSKIKDFENLPEIGNSIFSKKNVSDLKVPFVCASLNISKQVIYLLNRGPLDKLIPFCLAHPPLSQPYSQSVAEMHDIAALAQHLRATGANKIILINVLAQNVKRPFVADYLSPENILWAKSAALMAQKINGVTDTVNINLDDFNLTDIEKKREIIVKGAELSYDDVQKLTKKYGL